MSMVLRRPGRPFVPFEYRDPFNTNGLLSNYAQWDSYTHNGISLTVTSGAVTTNTASSDGSRTGFGVVRTSMQRGRCFVEARVAVRAPSAMDAGIYLHAPNPAGSTAPGSKFVGLVLTNSATRGIYTFDYGSGGSNVKRADISPLPANGGLVRLDADLNSSDQYVYTASLNGAVVATWTDVDRIAYPDASRRHCGLYCGFNRSFFSNTLSNGWDNFACGDLP